VQVGSTQTKPGRQKKNLAAELNATKDLFDHQLPPVKYTLAFKDLCGIIFLKLLMRLFVHCRRSVGPSECHYGFHNVSL
jgi:hypothetical protein